MLSEDEVKVLLVQRLIACCGSCNSHHIKHVEGQLRALVAVLTDGRRPDLSHSCTDVLDQVGIPWRSREDGGWEVPTAWLAARGCIIDPDDADSFSHPKLAEHW